VPAELERQLGAYDTDTDILAALAATAVFHGGPDTDRHILRAVRQLTDRPPVPASFMYPLAHARQYPALRIVTAAGVAAVSASREDLLVPLLLRTTSASANSAQETPLVQYLHPDKVLSSHALALMPLYQVSPPRWRQSHYLRRSCRAALSGPRAPSWCLAAVDR
jgi:hypothetical protein